MSEGETYNDQAQRFQDELDALTKALGHLESLEEAHLKAEEDSAERRKRLNDHQERFANILKNIRLDQWEKDAYNDKYLNELLQLRLTVEELLPQGIEPKYEKTKQVLSVLDDVSVSTNVMDSYKGIAQDTSSKVKDGFLEVFSHSQVDVDSMDHTAFFDAVETVKQCSEISLEVLVRNVNTEIQTRVSKYNEIVAAQLQRYNDEAAKVAATSAARLRAAKPEDEMDPWEVPQEQVKTTFESPILQQWYDFEINERLVEDYDAEWYRKQRAAIATLVPRAKRIVREIEPADFHQCLTLLDEIVSLCEEKGRIIDKASKDTGETAAALLEKLQQQKNAITVAGKEFQEKCKERQAACEHDINKIQTFVGDETARHERLLKQYEVDESVDLEWLQRNQQQIEIERQVLLEQQKKIYELTLLRRDRQEVAVRRAEEEHKRRATFAAKIALTERYLANLESSLRNYTAPQGYNSVLSEFAESCASAASASSSTQLAALFTLLQDSVQEATAFAATAIVAPHLTIARKEAKAADLLEKARQANRQHTFCLATNDPNAALNTELEAMMLKYAQGEVEAAEELKKTMQQRYNRFHDLVGLTERLQLAKVVPDPDEVVRSVLEKHGQYIIKGPRLPLTNLQFQSLDRAVVPSKFFLDDSQLRATGVGNSPPRHSPRR